MQTLTSLLSAVQPADLVRPHRNQLFGIQHDGSYDSGLYSGPIRSGGNTMSRPRIDLAGQTVGGSQKKFLLFLLFLPIFPIVILVSIGLKLRKRSKRIRAQTEFALDCKERGIHNADQVAVEWIEAHPEEYKVGRQHQKLVGSFRGIITRIGSSP